MLRNKPDFAHLCQLESSDLDYIKKANEKVNAMVRDQIYRNIARNALYSLIFILDEEEQGLDSFRIVEHLKSFFCDMAQYHAESAEQARQLLKQAEERNKMRVKKNKPGD